MTYFTSWDANLFLCLVSLGLPGDLVREWIKKMRKIHGELVLEKEREYHCHRENFVDMSKTRMLYFCRADLSDPFWHFPKAISRLESIPISFYQDYYNLQEEFKEKQELL